MKKLFNNAVIATAILSASSAYADIQFNGFANIVAGQASSGDTLWGYDDKVTFKQESLFALQSTADLGEGLSATVQILSRGENDWDTEFEWAYLGYQVTDNTRVTVGRQRTPFYLISEYLDVSYALPWISGPGGFYDLGADTFEGVGFHHSFSLAEFDASLQLIYGANSDDIDIAGSVISGGSVDDLTGASFSLQRDWLTVRAAYFTTDATYPIEPLAQLAGAWRGAGFEQVANDLVFNGDQAEFVEFGVQIDYNNFLMMAEYIEENYDGGTVPVGDEEAWYAMAGYRFGDVLVHFTYGKDDETPSSLINRLPNTPTGNPAFDGLIATTEGILETQRQDSSYYIIGARWDFHPSAALKVEYSDLMMIYLQIKPVLFEQL